MAPARVKTAVDGPSIAGAVRKAEATDFRLGSKAEVANYDSDVR